MSMRRLRLCFINLCLWFLDRPAALAVLAAVLAVPYLMLIFLLKAQPVTMSPQESLAVSIFSAVLIGVVVYISVVKYGQGD